MRLLVRLISLLVLLLVGLAALLAGNAYLLKSRQIEVAAVTPIPVDTQAAAQRLSTAVGFRTVSFSPALPPATEEFRKLHAHLESAFPQAHRVMTRETVGGLSLVYTWAGTDPKARPVLFMAHQDTVPIAPGTDGDWTHPPFSGAIADGFVWGRGSWDDKGNLMAMLEAIELLAAKGFQPKRSIVFAFGHDEELSGRNGAASIARKFKDKGLEFEFVLDEGMLLTEGIVPGIAKTVALIGVAEKGYATVELKANGVPGHSSMPPQDMAIAKMAKALAALNDHPMPAALKDVAKDMFATLAPEMRGINRLLMANTWITEPLLRREFEKSSSSNAMLRTTTALTVVQGGEKENVLPGRVQALVNFRLLPGDTISSVLERTRKLVGPDVSVELVEGGGEASPISPTTSAGYRAIERSIKEVFPDTIVAPGLMIAATDTRHMLSFSKNVYRFTPVRAKREDLTRFHGTNERLSLTNYADMIRFYHRLIMNVEEGQPISTARN